MKSSIRVTLVALVLCFANTVSVGQPPKPRPPIHLLKEWTVTLSKRKVGPRERFQLDATYVGARPLPLKAKLCLAETPLAVYLVMGNATYVVDATRCRSVVPRKEIRKGDRVVIEVDLQRARRVRGPSQTLLKGRYVVLVPDLRVIESVEIN
ncbi:MAG: hypothetical protein KC609_23150 [Myxococcales bacterium]|nr:hypothetical protein [Myxococcales bacterium]